MNDNHDETYDDGYGDEQPEFGSQDRYQLRQLPGGGPTGVVSIIDQQGVWQCYHPGTTIADAIALALLQNPELYKLMGYRDEDDKPRPGELSEQVATFVSKVGRYYVEMRDDGR